MLADYYLNLALTKSYGGYSLPSPSSRTTLAIEQLSRQVAADESQISGYGKLQAAVSAFQEAVQGFSTAPSVS